MDSIEVEERRIEEIKGERLKTVLCSNRESVLRNKYMINYITDPNSPLF